MKKIIGFIITILAMCSFAFCNIESKEVVYASGEEEAVFNTPECYQQAKGLWSSFVIGGSSIATSGCGLLSLTNAVNYLTGNFIEPTNLAKYAYSIDAYNGSIGGGTARWVLYNQLQAYEKKYGFKVTSAGRDGTITRPDVKAHLKKGGTVIAHVYGHFIAIVGYNEVNNTYCVYDCAANASKRYSYPYGTWLSEDILKNSQYMSVDWYCLLERATNSIVKLDQEGGTYKNSKATVSYFVTSNENTLIDVSGFALDERGIESFFYIVDDKITEQYPLSTVARYDIYDKFTNYQVCDPTKIGFEGQIDTTKLTKGTHRIIISAKTPNGGVCDVATVMINKGTVDGTIDKVNKTNTVEMSRYSNQAGLRDTWPEAGIYQPCFRAEYNYVLDLGQIDFSNYKRADIYYSTDQSFISNKDGVQSVIGFKNSNYSFGYHGMPLDLKDSIAYTNMINARGGWTTDSVVSVDLTNINYNGPTYLSGYNQESALYVVKKVVFYYNDDYEFHNFKEATCTVPKTCTDCGATEGEALGHYYLPATCLSPSKCFRCGDEVGEVGSHDYIEATCTTPKTCRYCNEVVGTANGHNYERKTKKATCKEAGAIYDECSVCKDVQIIQTEDKLPHELVHHDGKPAECIKTGYEAYDTCKNCDYTTYKELPILMHNYIETVVPPTCESKGYTLHSCTRCKNSYRTNEKAKLPHKESDWIISEPATCVDSGKEIIECEVCHTIIKEREIEALGHDIIKHEALEATCENIGHYAYQTCSRCDYTTYEEIPALGHDYYIVIINPTKQQDGYTIHRCNRCSESYTDNYTTVKSNCKKSSIATIIAMVTTLCSCLYIYRSKKN